MRRTTALLASLALVTAAAVTPPAAAQEKFTPILASSELPTGTLTVKVVGEGMADLKVGIEVTLDRVDSQGASRLKTTRSGEDGRARFTGLVPSASYRVRVKSGDKEIRSARFQALPAGGMRLLLNLGGGLPAGHPGAGAPAPRPHQAPVTENAARAEPAPGVEAGKVTVVVAAGVRRMSGVAVQVVSRATDAAAATRTLSSSMTDASGQAVVDLPRDAKGALFVQVSRGGATYRSARLTPPADGGLKVTFAVPEETSDPGDLTLGPRSHWVCKLTEEALTFMQVIHLLPRGGKIFRPGPGGLLLPVPRGAVQVELAADVRGLLRVDSQGVRLLGPVPVGGVLARVYYSLKTSDATVEFRQKVPMGMKQSLLVLLNGQPGVALQGPHIRAGKPNETGPGTIFPVAAVSAGATLEISFLGLPHRDTQSFKLVLSLVGLIILWGIVAAALGRARSRRTRTRREQIMEQLVQITRARKKRRGKSRAELKQELLEISSDEW